MGEKLSEMISRRRNMYRVSQNWRTNYLLPYRGCLNVYGKNVSDKKINYFYYYY
jgi:hypothetical protein